MGSADDRRQAHLEKIAARRISASGYLDRRGRRFRLESCVSRRAKLWWMMASSTWWWVGVFPTLGLGIVLDELLASPRVAWLGVAAPVAAWLALRVVIRRDVAAERAWVAARPFEVVGYLEALGDREFWNSQIALHFSPPVPIAETLATLNSSEVVWSHDAWEDTFRCDAELVSDDKYALAPSQKLRDWFHRLCAHELVSMHHTHGVRVVTLINF